jgi:bile-acid 7alpha-dehydratase
MSDVKELEKRILALEKECRRLSDIESIRQMRYRYWRAIRNVDLDALLELFSENPWVDFGLGQPAEGKEAVTKLYRATVGTWKPGGQYPRGFVPEIERTGDTTAKGAWMVEAQVLDREKKLVTNVGCLYDEEYVKENGEWKINRLKNSYTYNQYTSMVPPK